MKNSNYPAQTGHYAVKVKNGAGWHDFRAARLQISVGGERHEGDKFKATIEWVKPRFDKAIICVNDTLQRFNYANQGMTEKEAFQKALLAGDEWLSRYEVEIETLPCFKIYRWEDWKGQAFDQEHQRVCALYNENEKFRQAVANSQKNSLSKDYLLEEVAVFSLMYKKERAVDIYPGTLPQVMSIFHDQHTARIDFIKRKLAA